MAEVTVGLVAAKHEPLSSALNSWGAGGWGPTGRWTPTQLLIHSNKSAIYSFGDHFVVEHGRTITSSLHL